MTFAKPWNLSSARAYDASTNTSSSTTPPSHSDKESSTSPSCFCGFVPNKTVPANRFFVSQASGSNNSKEVSFYTDDALAKDLNALSFHERQHIQHDIHGVVTQDDLPKETPEFVDTKIKELLDCIDNMPLSKAKWPAWHRVKYLRPALVKESDHLLLFLRAKRYDVFAAAQMLVKFYESKGTLYGEHLLIPRRIIWKDLSEQARKYILEGVFQMVPRKPLNRPDEINLRYLRTHIWDFKEDPLALVQAIRYTLMGLENDPEVQRKGQHVIIDSRRGPATELPGMDVVQFMRDNVHHFECIPEHNSGFHILMSIEQQGSIFEQGVKVIQGLMSRNHRVRFRFHFGSWMEIRYQLRTFGIDFPVDPFYLDDSPLALAAGNPFSKHYIIQELKRRQEIEDAWQAQEVLYQHWSSPIAMYPNSQDIIMGRQRNVFSTWPGNLKYNQVIQRLAPLYLAVESRHDKSDIAVQAMQALTSPTENDVPSRFLGRLEDYWEILDDKDVIGKISQSLRDEARKLRQQKMLQSTAGNLLS